jgi:hypothetical protein
VSVRDEFEKAFSERYPNGSKPPFKNHNFTAALWAATWAMERCAKELQKGDYNLADVLVRQFSKELSHDTE